MNGLDDRINIKGYFESILKEREKLEEERDRRMEERFARINDRFEAIDKALVLQAEEYARRLADLNGEYVRDRNRQSDYVTTDKWEATNKAESTARAAALLRVDEKFEEYVKRYEVRQREVDLLLAAQAGAADEAKRAVEDQGRKSDAFAREQGRKQSRNLGIASIGLGAIVFLANIVPLIAK